MKIQQLSIIIPVFNEMENVLAIIPRIFKYSHVKKEILIVYDYPEDNTLQAKKVFKNKFKNVHFVKNEFQPGLINAIKTGVSRAKGDTILIMSPDLSDDPRIIDKMYEKIKKGSDIVSASRYAPGGERMDQFSIKYLLSKLAGQMAPIILGVQTNDITNGYKMYRKKIFSAIQIESSGGWEFTLEIMVKSNFKKYTITEIPTVSHKRIYGASKFKVIHWLPKYLYWYYWGFKKRLLNLIKF